jgi:hypothetical protein
VRQISPRKPLFGSAGGCLDLRTSFQTAKRRVWNPAHGFCHWIPELSLRSILE